MGDNTDMTTAVASVRTSIERYFQASQFLLIAAGFVTLASTGRLDFLSLLSVSLALLLRGVLLARGSDARIPERWTSYITLAYVAFYALDYFVLTSRNFVTATVHLVLFAMAVKIFSVYRMRDHVYLAVLAFLEILAASVLTVDTTFFAVFFVFIVLAVNTFVSFEMYRAALAARAQARDSAQNARRMPRLLSATAFVLVGGILLIAVAIFFLLPRMTAGYLSALAPRNDILSGFSNDVNLGRIGLIKQSNTVVMHVQFADRAHVPADWKLRGISLGLFDGTRWSNPPRDRGEFATLFPSYGHFTLSPLYLKWDDAVSAMQLEGPRRSLEYRVLMEPLTTPVFFLVAKPEILQGPYRAITASAGGALMNADPERRNIDAYAAISYPDQPAPDLLRKATGGTPPGIQLRYLQLPGHVDARIRRLAEQITASSKTAYDKAAAIETYLKTHYGYTLQLPAAVQEDPLANFLFERKQGHCEYFASAMALMLRTIGVPSRVVNGFRGGEFNDLTGRYVIRARDAHSWVEAWFPQYGWITFDPTPPDPQPTASAWNRFLLYVDAGRDFWREWIVNYDFSHQRTLAITARDRGSSGAVRGRDWLRQQYTRLLERASWAAAQANRAPRQWGVTGVVVFVCGFLLLNARRLVRSLRQFRLARHPEHAPSSAAGIWYLRLVRLLARRGWQKSAAQTPEEFLATIADPGVRASVAAFTSSYQRARFGNSVEDATALPRLYEDVLKS